MILILTNYFWRARLRTSNQKPSKLIYFPSRWWQQKLDPQSGYVTQWSCGLSSQGNDEVIYWGFQKKCYKIEAEQVVEKKKTSFFKRISILQTYKLY